MRAAPEIGLRGLAAVLALFALFGFNPQALAATDTWTGADTGPSSDWATADNWSYSGGGVGPVASGDSLVFTSTNGAGTTTLTDSLTTSSFLINGITFSAGAPAYTMTGNGFELGGAITNSSANTQTFDNAITLAATETLKSNASGGNLIFSGGILAGTGGITASGGGTVTLNTTASTYTGNTAINQGTNLTLDFNAAAVTGNSNLINNASPLQLATGTLRIVGNASSASSQTFASTGLVGGANFITAAPASGASIPTVALGTTAPTGQATGATLEITGPASNSNADTAGGTNGSAEAALTGASPGAVAATATITTTTEGQQTTEGLGDFGLLVNNQGAAYATVGLYDWATTDVAAGTAGTTPWTIIGGSQVAGFYTIMNGAATVGQAPNYDVTANSNFGGGTGGNSATIEAATMRFNVNAAITLGVNTNGATGNPVNCAGILVTPNVGQNNITFTANGADGLNSGSHDGGIADLTVFQNNTSGELIFTQSTGGAANALIRGGTYTQSGAGTVSFLGINNYTGITYLDGGVLEIAEDTSVGLATAPTNVSMNGGTLVGNYTGNLDSGSVSGAHAIVLGSVGGGLGATAGNTFTVDGVVSGGAGTGPLVIGIPASAANGSTAGLLPGTGAGTANATAVNATGVVVLSNASNTYTGGTVLDSGTLQLASASNIGTGAVTFNGGAFQWGSGSTTDISANGLSVTSLGGTLDTNGNTVTLANPIVGSGGIKVVNSSGSGSITSNGNNTFTGGVTVTSGGLSFGGSNVYTGPTSVTGGSLTLKSGSSLGGNTAVTIGSGATLNAAPTGNGNINIGSTGATLTLSGGSSLSLTALDADTTDTLTLNSTAATGGGTVLTVGGASTPASLTFDIGSAGSDEIVVNQGLTAFGADGGKIFITDLDTNTPQSTYTLVSDPSGGLVAGGISAGADFWLGSTGLSLGGQNYALSLTSSGTSLVLHVTVLANANYYWAGSGGSSWGTISNFVTAATGGTPQTTALSASSNVFLTANSASNLAQTLDGNYTVNSLSFTGSGTSGASGVSLGNGSGTGLIINAGNSFADSAGNTYAAGTGIVVQPGAGADTITANINLGNSQTWLVNNSPSNPLTVSGVIADAIPGSNDSLTKTGAGTLILNNAEAYDGATTVSGGTLAMGSSGSIPTTSVLTVTGTGTFDLGGTAVTVAKLSDGGASTGIITSSNGSTPATLTINNSVANSFSGTITDTNATNGASLALSLVGASNVTLSGSNSFTGGTSLTSGNLTVSNNYGLGSVTSTNANAGLLMNPAAATTSSVFFTSANPQVALLNNGAAGGTSKVILGNSTGTATTLNIGNGGINGTSESLFGGTISDLSATVPGAVGSLNVENGGFVILTAANTYTGTTSITGANSELELQNAAAIQDSTLNYNNQGGTIVFSGISTVTLAGLTGAQNLALTNAGAGAVALSIGNNNVSSNYTGNLGGLGSLTKNGSGTVQIGGGLAGGATYAGNTTVLGGTLILGGTTSLAGTIAVTSGGLTVQDNASIVSTTGMYLDEGAGDQPGAANVTLSGTGSLTVANFAWGRAGTTQGDDRASGTMTIQNSASFIDNGYFDVLNNDGGTGTAEATTTNLNSGTLAVQNFLYVNPGVAAGSLATINLNGGTLKALASDPTGSQFIPAFAKFNLNVDAGGAIINTNGFNDTIAQPLIHAAGTPDGGLTVKDTVGTGSLTLTGVNTYTGPTTINAGGTLQLGNGTNTGDGTIATSSGITDNGSLIYNRFGNLTSAVPISGTGTVAKIGAGEEVLSALNNYTGASSVSAGTLEVTGSLSATASVSVTGGATLELGDNNALNAVAPISLNTGVLQVLATQTEALGTLTLSGGGADTLTLGASGDIINFADSSALAWTGTLVISDWTGASAGGGSDEVFIGTTNDLTAAQLADITFTNGTLDGNAFATYTAVQLADGEIVASAIPEPGTWAMLFAGAGMLCVWQRSRRRGHARPSQTTGTTGA